MQRDNETALRRLFAGHGLRPALQPIVDLRHRSVFGYESLIRPPAGCGFETPDELSAGASSAGLTPALDEACLQASCRAFAAHGCRGRLFLNMSLETLGDADCLQRLLDWFDAGSGVAPGDVVIEIGGQFSAGDDRHIHTAAGRLRAAGMEIALDDLSTGYPGLRTWSALRPHYVKVHRRFLSGMDTDPVRREFVRAIRRSARELNCRVIALGIESATELAAARLLDIDFAQGSLLGHPAPEPEHESAVVARAPQQQDGPAGAAGSDTQVGQLAISVPVLTVQHVLDEAVDLFQTDRNLTSVPVIEAERVIGILKRQDLLELMAGRYSRELYGKRPVTQFMDTRPLCVDHRHSLEYVSRRLTSGGDSELSQDFVILREGRFHGVGRTGALLRRITEQQIQYARFANPLTQLPGNPAVHQALNEALSAGRPIRVAYVDLNHFKPYNDYYGYDAGDAILVALGRILQDVVDGTQDFLGHIGGDDFVIIFRSQDWQARCAEVLSRFGQATPSFYDAPALSEGGIRSRNRRGEEEFFQLISVAIGVVDPDPAHCGSSHDVARLAAEAKQQAKSRGGNALFVSRRRRPSPGDARVAAARQPPL